MEKLTPKHLPYTSQELIDSGWVDRVRRAIVDNGNAVRVGKDFSIESQVINSPSDWRPIMLPNGGTLMIDGAQCAMVIDMLEGKTPIPPPTPQPPA